MIRLTSKFQNGAVKKSTLEKALVQFVDRMDDQEALQRVTARKNNNVGGQVYIPAIDYNVPDLFAGEYASKKMEFSILASVLAQMDCRKEEEEAERKNCSRLTHELNMIIKPKLSINKNHNIKLMEKEIKLNQ